MKRLFKILFLAAMIVALAVPAWLPGQAFALDPLFSKFMTGTTAGGTLGTTYTYGAYVVIPGDNNSQVVIASLSGTSDGTAATHNIYVYDKENQAVVNSASAAGTSTVGISSGGASFDTGDIIVFQDASGATTFAETLASSGATTMTLNGTLDYAITATGWKVYEMTQIGTIPIGNGTVSYGSDVAVIAGQKDSPVLLWLGGSAACSINFASGHYR